jgi:alpha-tubulin suppressor-like RCC1 family protein
MRRVAVGSLFLLGCGQPTQVTLDIWTDLPCDRRPATEIRVGVDLVSSPPSRVVAATQTCTPPGRIGSLVFVPDRDDSAPLAIEVAMVFSAGAAPAPALAHCRRGQEGPRCVVANRALRFVPHAKLYLPIIMRATCESVTCAQSYTCVDRSCRSAMVPDPRVCQGPTCTESILAAPDAGAADAAPPDAAPDLASSAQAAEAIDAPQGDRPLAFDAGPVDLVPDGPALCQPGVTRCRAGEVQACDGDRWRAIGVSCSVEPRVVAGANHTCALRDDGRIQCWGANESGQLGLGDRENRGDDLGEMGPALAAVDLGSGHFAIAVAAGGAHTCALLDDLTVKCWGDNSSGQLGQEGGNRGDDPGEMGDDLPELRFGNRQATRIVAGGQHTCVTLDNEAIRCWGANAYGQLGLGDTTARVTPPTTDLELGPAPNPSDGYHLNSLVAGGFHTCAIISPGVLKCWGRNDSGQLGLGDQRNRGIAPEDMGAALPAVTFGRRRLSALNVSAGRAHTCAVAAPDQDQGDGVYCWGANESGQLGLGDTLTRGTRPGDLDRLPPARALAVSGLPSRGALALGGQHTCAILDNLVCWGANANGQLGQGDLRDRGSSPSDPVMALRPILPAGGDYPVSLVAGGAHNCLLLEGGKIKCWGANEHGQLGDESRADRGGHPGDFSEWSAINLGP